MIYIAKLITRYPEFHGSGYYNFIMKDNEDDLYDAIDGYGHDFKLDSVVKTRHHSIENIVKKYPSKTELNERYFQ